MRSWAWDWSYWPSSAIGLPNHILFILLLSKGRRSLCGPWLFRCFAALPPTLSFCLSAPTPTPIPSSSRPGTTNEPHLRPQPIPLTRRQSR
jgi:hypothetical protein